MDPIPALPPATAPAKLGTKPADRTTPCWPSRSCLAARRLRRTIRFDLGSGFDLGGTHDLTFQYHDFVSGAIVTGEVTYPIVVAGVQGDYNNNGMVDAADYVLWRKGGPLQNDPTPGVSAADYTFWRSRFGSNTGSGVGDGLSARPYPNRMPGCFSA